MDHDKDSLFILCKVRPKKEDVFQPANFSLAAPQQMTHRVSLFFKFQLKPTLIFVTCRLAQAPSHVFDISAVNRI